MSSTVLSHSWQLHYFFSFWEVRERQGTGSPLSPRSLAWEYRRAINGLMHVWLLLREFLHKWAWSVGLCVCVCVVSWAPVCVNVNVKCRQRCLAIFLWCGGSAGGVCVSAIDTIHQLDVIPIQRSQITSPSPVNILHWYALGSPAVRKSCIAFVCFQLVSHVCLQVWYFNEMCEENTATY